MFNYSVVWWGCGRFWPSGTGFCVCRTSGTLYKDHSHIIYKAPWDSLAEKHHINMNIFTSCA